MQIQGCNLMVTESQNNLGLKEAFKLILFNFLNYNV